jgi:hypothetical protein
LQGGGRTGGSELESAPTEGDSTQSKHDEVVEGVGVGKPVEMDKPEAVEEAPSSSVHGSGHDECGDGSPPVRSLSDELPSRVAKLNISDEVKENPGEQAEQGGLGAAVVEGRNVVSSVEKDSVAVVEGQ